MKTVILGAMVPLALSACSSQPDVPNPNAAQVRQVYDRCKEDAHRCEGGFVIRRYDKSILRIVPGSASSAAPRDLLTMTIGYMDAMGPERASSSLDMIVPYDDPNWERMAVAYERQHVPQERQ